MYIDIYAAVYVLQQVSLHELLPIIYTDAQ